LSTVLDASGMTTLLRRLDMLELLAVSWYLIWSRRLAGVAGAACCNLAANCQQRGKRRDASVSEDLSDAARGEGSMQRCEAPGARHAHRLDLPLLVRV
jgi:hypothetical protein